MLFTRMTMSAKAIPAKMMHPGALMNLFLKILMDTNIFEGRPAMIIISFIQKAPVAIGDNVSVSSLAFKIYEELNSNKSVRFKMLMVSILYFRI